MSAAAQTQIPATLVHPSLQEPSEMEVLARRLEESGNFRVLRRLDVGVTGLPDVVEEGRRLACLVDVETTGLDLLTDEVISLAAVPFQYDGDGTVTAVHEPIDCLRDPGRPIPAEVTRLTGIDDAMVKGRSIDADAVGQLLSRVNLVVAHNAAFDRRFLERLLPVFADVPWACSMADVPWSDEGVTTLKLDVMASRCGFFYDAHRALDDCMAVVEILRRPLPRSGRSAMSELLCRAKSSTYRIVAVASPFSRKDLLKTRRYRWEPFGDGMAWTKEVPADRLSSELSFLEDEVYGRRVELPVVRLTARTRYSGRV